MFLKLLELIKKTALMIKINVITNNKKWFDYINNPNRYLDRKVYKLNKNNNKIKKKKIYCTLLLSGNKEIKSLNKKFRIKLLLINSDSFFFCN